jgi:RHS repeat-associated protein
LGSRKLRQRPWLWLLALSLVHATGGNVVQAQALSPAPARNASQSLEVQYDANGNVKSKTARSGAASSTTAYDYDSIDRLKSETGPAATQAFTLDANGNRTAVSPPPGAVGPFPNAQAITYQSGSDRIATFNGISVTLDAAGYLKADGGYQYTWDDWGNLKELRKADGTLLSTYHYDHQHLRTRKVTTAATPQGAQTVFYHHDPSGRIIGESDGSAQPLKTYIWRDDTLTGVVVHQPSRVVYTVEVDHLGSPWQVRNLQGQVVWRWNSAAYGSTPPDEDPDGNGQAFSLNLRFPGQYFDAESGLHYNWHRYYSPKLGRYISSDPIGFEGGLNTYGYVEANPLSKSDPMGLYSWSDVPDAWKHYCDGTGTNWYTGFNSLNWGDSEVTISKKIEAMVGGTCKDATIPVDIDTGGQTKGADWGIIGRADLSTRGSIKLSCDCTWSFSGDISAAAGGDLYDANKSNRSFFAESATTALRNSCKGKQFMIYITGSKSLALSGKINGKSGCCEK